MPPSTWTTNSTTAPAKTPSSATRPHQRTVDRPEGSGQCSLPTLARDEPAALSARATEVAAMGVMVVFRLASGADSSGPGQFGHERVLEAEQGTSVPLTWAGRELEGAT